MNNIFINGSIGYIYLKNSKNNNEILLLSDNHSSENYCRNQNKNENKFISEWLETKKSKILLEEVPRIQGNVLLELWSSKHIKKLKDLYLKNNRKNIEGIDIRSQLVPFSLDIFKLEKKDLDKNDDEYINLLKKNITVKEYFKLLDLFFNYEHKYFIEKLEKTYLNLSLSLSLSLRVQENNELNQHFQILKENFNNLILKITNIFNSIDEINFLIDSIMEWYIIAKIDYHSKYNINKFIIHAGLNHTTNINNLLKKFYKYYDVKSDGETNIHKIKDDNNNCLKLPTDIDNKFGGYKKKYFKYKKKYLQLKSLNK